MAADELRSGTHALMPWPKAQGGTCTAKGDCVPVVFIHGINGTASAAGLHTAATEDAYWRPLLDSIRLNPAVWNRIRPYDFRYVSNQEPVSTIGGDWLPRRLLNLAREPDCSAGCEDLAAVVEGRGRLIIVAHSMGGLVARQFMSGPFGGGKGADAVLAAITLGTPHHGTPAANYILRHEYVRKYAPDAADRQQDLLTADWVVWSKLYGAPELEHNAEKPNRSDLLWDDFDGMFDEVRSNYPGVEVNRLLPNLRSPGVHAKLIVYGGFLQRTGTEMSAIGREWIREQFAKYLAEDEAQQAQSRRLNHVALEYFSTLMLAAFGVSSDGVVPLGSALFSGNSQLAGRRGHWLGYDHSDMAGNPLHDERWGLNAALHKAVIADLDSVLTNQGVPLTVSAIALLDPYLRPGAKASVRFRVKNANGETKQADLSIRIEDATGKTQCVTQAVPVPAAPIEAAQVDVAVDVPAGFAAGPITFTGGLGSCSSLSSAVLPAAKTGGNLLPAVGFSRNPTISLKLAEPGKTTFRLGDRLQIRVVTQQGTLAIPDVPVLTTPGGPAVSPVVRVEHPNGRAGYLVLNGDESLTEVSSIAPLTKAGPVVTAESVLDEREVLPNPETGAWTWVAELYMGSDLSPSNRISASAPLTYTISAERATEPSITSLSVPVSVYRPKDVMTIHYYAVAGTSAAAYDLMLKITSDATGTDYYFYDNPADRNRWIHTTPKAMWTGKPQDGPGQIPSGSMPPIEIEDSTPSGTFAMVAYFSRPGENKPVGPSAQSTFQLITPTAEGGCFIATASFGSPMAASVQCLRLFRDRVLLSSSIGTSLVRTYYVWSPAWAEKIRSHRWARKAVRVLLWPAVAYAFVANQAGIWFSSALFMMLAVALLFGAVRGSKAVRLGIAAMLLAGAAAAADLRGTVVRQRPYPEPLAGAAVTIAEGGRSAVTGQDGAFAFANIPAGTYTLTIENPGFMAAKTAVTVPAAGATTVISMQPSSRRSYEYFLPHTAETDGWWTFFALLNTGSTSAELNFAAFDAKGTFLERSTKLALLRVGEQASGAPSAFFSQDTGQRAAWYRVRSSAPLAGFEIFGQNSGTLAAFSLTEARSTRLYYPHIAWDAQWWTGISFLAAGNRPANVSLKMRGRTGELVAEAPEPSVLYTGEKSVNLVPGYFGWDFPASPEWATLEGDGPLAGFELFGTRDYRMMAAVPASGEGARKFVFPHVTTGGGWWTGVAMLNAGEAAGTVSLSAYAADGKLLGSSNAIPLRPGERSVNVVESYFPQWPVSAVWVEGSSDAEIIAFELPGRFSPPSMGGMAAATQAGSCMLWPYVVSDGTWKSGVGVINTGGTAAAVRLDGFAADGGKLIESRFTLAPKAARTATTEDLFGSRAGSVRWIRAVADGADLTGFLKLERRSSGEFTDVAASACAAEPADPSSQRVSSMAAAGGSTGLLARVRFADADGGVLVTWPREIDAEIRRAAGADIRSGDVVTQVGAHRVRTRQELFAAAAALVVNEAPVQVRVRRDGVEATISLQPAQTE